MYYSVRVPQLNQRRAAEWRGRCPIHRGKNDNFAVDAKTGFWFCHSACGKGGDILGLENELKGGDFLTRKTEVFRLIGRNSPVDNEAPMELDGSPAKRKPAQKTRRSGTLSWSREVERYPYEDPDGNLLFEVVRGLKADGTKTFVQVRPSGSKSAATVDVNDANRIETGSSVRGLGAGLYVPHLNSTRPGRSTLWKPVTDNSDLNGSEAWFGECPRVPYRLRKILGCDTVYLVEGEKDVQTLESLGIVASCNPGGCGSGHLYFKWAEYFRSRHIVIIPDNDTPGRKHAATVSQALLSIAASVKIVELPGLAAKQDVTDWRDRGGTIERLRELVESVNPIDEASLSAFRMKWKLADDPSAESQVEVADRWPTLSPLESELPPLVPFSVELLPSSFRALAADIAERMQVPLDYPAVVMMLCLAGVVNRRALMQPKANDTGWVVVPNLWGGIIAPPGFMKSPVIQAATRPLNNIQTEWRNAHAEALKEYAREKEEFELRRQAWKEQFKAKAKKSQGAPERPEDEPEEPYLRRLTVNDATFEALHETMKENPAGVLVIRDEFTGWWSQLDRAGREGERAFCLQAWNGDTGHTIDRIGRGTIHVQACCMSMLGGIQPGRLRSYLVDALDDGPNNDGLIQRFQLLVWPDTAAPWRWVDKAPDRAAENLVEQVYRNLVQLDEANPPLLRFAPDAQLLFVEWLSELEEQIRGDELHPAVSSHFSKYRSLMPSLALICELADRGSIEGFDGSALVGSENFVSLEHTRQAASWCDYLGSHARRVYSCIVSPQLRAAQELASKIKSRKIGSDGTFSCRDVYLKGWSGLSSPEVVKQAADILQAAGWIRELSKRSSRSGGRPSDRFEVNPELRK
jgi:putative DNA primase/helicase